MNIARENENLILKVDRFDREIRLINKKDTHVQGVLHRSLFNFHFHEVATSVQLLLQQRAFHKYHSGGLWTNTCCSHAEPNVPIETTASNRLQAEMEFSCPIQDF